MHEHFGVNAGRDPDPAIRAYRIDVLLDGVPEAAGVALMHEIADLLVELGLGRDEDGDDVHAFIALNPHDWSGEHRELAHALHVVVPTAIPRSPGPGPRLQPELTGIPARRASPVAAVITATAGFHGLAPWCGADGGRAGSP